MVPVYYHHLSAAPFLILGFRFQQASQGSCTQGPYFCNSFHLSDHIFNSKNGNSFASQAKRPGFNLADSAPLSLSLKSWRLVLLSPNLLRIIIH